jgi:cell division protein FtsI (penicillin-binding protein 3)
MPGIEMAKRRNTRWMRIRLFSVAGLMLLCALGLLYRIWTLQVSQSGWLEGLAQEQYLKEITLEPMRGAIVDRHGAPMAVSVMTDSIFAMPREMADKRNTARKLANVLELDPNTLDEKFSSRKHFTWIKRRVPPREVERVRELNLPGVYFTRESRRYYPSRELAGSIVGFAGDGRGLEGVELIFDGRLRGSTVLAQGLRDAHGNLLFADGINPQDFSSGGKLVLTIDLTIQEIVETELDRAVRQSRARAGTAVVIKPRSGEILAMANVPLFNPNTFWRYARSAPQRFRNRAVTDCYEPGSTMKVFTMAAALQQGVVEPGESIDCGRGRLEVGDHIIHDSSGKKHDRLLLGEVLVHSSNVGMAHIAERLGKSGLWGGLRRFGFGRRTGVDLPGESRCVLRQPDSWSDVGLATVSFGQGVSATPLQLVTALGAVANGGVWMRPLVVKEIRGPRDELLQKFEPEPAGRVLDSRWAKVLTRMMVGVTQAGGTGARAAVPGFDVAGKTGTAQKVDPIAGGYSKDKRVASFMGFVPAEQPRIALRVVVDEPETSPYGGVVAAPAFARMAAGILRYLGVFPRGQLMASPAEEVEAEEAEAEEELVELLPHPVAPPSPGPNPMPDLRGFSVREALRVLSERGVEVTVVGSGRVQRQDPPPGAAVGRPVTVSLILERRAEVIELDVFGTELAVLEQESVE